MDRTQTEPASTAHAPSLLYVVKQLELEGQMLRDLDPRAQATFRAALDSCRRALGTPQRDPRTTA